MSSPQLSSLHSLSTILGTSTDSLYDHGGKYSEMMIEEKLLDEEHARYEGTRGIQTVIFFKDATDDWKEGRGHTVLDKLIAHTAARLHKVLLANPWIQGRLKRCDKGKGGCKLVYPNKVHYWNIHELLSSRKAPAEFSRESAYTEINKACVELCAVQDAKTLIKTGAPITKVVILPISEDEVAMCVSISSLVVDRRRYYQILDMIGSKSAPGMLREVFMEYLL